MLNSRAVRQPCNDVSTATSDGKGEREVIERPWLVGLLVLAGVLTLLSAVAATAQEGVEFRDPLTNQPLELRHRPDQEITGAVEQFHQTGDNPYSGEEQAVAEGQRLYARWCQSCHLPDGSGRIGPSLIDDRWKYERTATDAGMFEIIYAGGAGAMQAFGLRLDQDEILKVMAHLEALRAER
jgi:cytochrome c-L